VQEPVADAVPVPEGVPGVVVVDASGVDVGGMSVGRDKPGLVGGRVEVTKTERVGATVAGATVMQEPRLRLASRSNIQIFFIRGFYLGTIAECRGFCLTLDLNFNLSIRPESLRAQKHRPGTTLESDARECRDDVNFIA
jgi:hypothetical protein